MLAGLGNGRKYLGCELVAGASRSNFFGWRQAVDFGLLDRQRLHSLRVFSKIQIDGSQLEYWADEPLNLPSPTLGSLASGPLNFSLQLHLKLSMVCFHFLWPLHRQIKG